VDVAAHVAPHIAMSFPDSPWRWSIGLNETRVGIDEVAVVGALEVVA
jgi:hypothetical protein